MNYIYKDSAGKECTGSIRALKITPLFDFMIKINGEYIWCQMDHALEEWCIHFINVNKNVEIAYPTDVIWNTEALYEVFKDVDTSKKIAYAIKTVFEEVKGSKDASLM